MSYLSSEISKRKAGLVGVSLVLLVTAFTYWTWKSSNTGISQKDPVKKNTTPQESKEDESEQSQVTKEVDHDEAIVVESEQVVILKEDHKESTVMVVEEVNKETESVEFSEESEVVVVEEVDNESHFDESESTKSYPTSSSTTDEAEIYTPEHETSNDEDLIQKDNNELFIQNEKVELFEYKEETFVKDNETKEEYIMVENALSLEKSLEHISSSIDESKLLSSTLTADAPEFIPQFLKQKKPTKKSLTREQLVEQQRQHHTPKSKARCSHWPHCTNNNCKFFHPYRPCRAGDECLFGNKCMFLHPSDLVPKKEHKKNHSYMKIK